MKRPVGKMTGAFRFMRRVSALCSRVAWGFCWRVILGVWILLASTILLMRYVAAPQVAAHREDIAQAISNKLGLKVSIGELQADWSGFHPELRMRNVRIADKTGRDALALPAVDAALAWSSLFNLRIEFSHLHIQRPDLYMWREQDGKIFVAGIAVQPGHSDGSFGDFIAAQDEIRIDDATVHWNDLQRGAPRLEFDKLSLLLQNDGDAHRFAISAVPDAKLSGPLDIRGDLRGDSWQDLASWRGALYLDLTRSDLAVWRRWVDYPVNLPEGQGAVRAWLNFEGKQVGALTAELSLNNVRARLASDLPMLALNSLSGRIKASMRGDDYAVSAERLQLATREGLRVGPTQFSLRHIAAHDKQPAGGEFSAERLDMGVLAQLAAYLPLPDNMRERLKAAEPQGLVSRVQTSWSGEGQGAHGLPAHFSLDTAFERVSVKPGEDTPGVVGLAGRIRGTEREGTSQFEIRNGSLDVPGILHEAHVAVTGATLESNWAHDDKDALTVRVNRLLIDNPDLAQGEFSGTWRSEADTAGEIDLSGTAQRADPGAVWRYMPMVVPQETIDWLQRGLNGGAVTNLKLKLAGNLSKFPFRNTPGAFRIDGDVAGVNLDFAPGWPALNNLNGELSFDRTRMMIHARNAAYRRVRLYEVRADMADLANAHDNPLKIVGHATGPAVDMLDYVRASPVAKHLGSFIQNVRVEGDTQLLLNLNIPLLAADETKVDGSVRFDNNVALIAPGVPLLRQVRGSLGFNDHGIGPTQLAGQFMGGAVSATGRTLADGTIQFDAGGTIPASGLTELFASPVWPRLTGQTPATARITVTHGKSEVVVRSDLQGIASALPAPLSKTADARMPFNFTWALADEAGTAGAVNATVAANSIQDWQLALGDVASARWQDRCNASSCDFLRGVVGVGDNPALPARGLRLGGRFHSLDLDQWRPLLLSPDAKPATAGKGNAVLAGAALQADDVVMGGYHFGNVLARAVDQGDHWALRLSGPDVVGDLSWAGGGQGRLVARLSTLKLIPVMPPKGETAQAASSMFGGSDDKLPALDVQADIFELRGLALGKLTLRADNEGNKWLLRDLQIENSDGIIKATGTSATPPGGKQQTDVELDLSSENVGGLLGRFGFHDALRKGRATLRGHLSWNALPTSIDYASLSGDLRLDAEDGQFNKLEAGAGRLLGILSLQSISRRLTLDFKDIFSDGFAFDTIKADLKISNGVLNTNNLELKSPGATVFMRGTTDLAKERHDLRVTVQPRLSDSVAIGVGLANPVAGVVTYVVQKILRDPFEKVFGFEYSVTGDWSEPKIEKLGSVVLREASAPASDASSPRR